MTTVDDLRHWFDQHTVGEVEVEVRELAELCEAAGLLDEEFRGAAVREHVIALFRRFFQADHAWGNVPGRRHRYKQMAFWDEDDFRGALRRLDAQIDGLVSRRNEVAARAQGAGIHAGQMRLVVEVEAPA